MKTFTYNPSIIETTFAKALLDMRDDLSERLEDMEIVEMEDFTHFENPDVVYKLRDKDGDEHEVVIRVIQRIDF